MSDGEARWQSSAVFSGLLLHWLFSLCFGAFILPTPERFLAICSAALTFIFRSCKLVKHIHNMSLLLPPYN